MTADRGKPDQISDLMLIFAEAIIESRRRLLDVPTTSAEDQQELRFVAQFLSRARQKNLGEKVKVRGTMLKREDIGELANIELPPGFLEFYLQYISMFLHRFAQQEAPTLGEIVEKFDLNDDQSKCFRDLLEEDRSFQNRREVEEN